jgi:hypothetical protein
MQRLRVFKHAILREHNKLRRDQQPYIPIRYSMNESFDGNRLIEFFNQIIASEEKIGSDIEKKKYLENIKRQCYDSFSYGNNNSMMKSAATVFLRSFIGNCLVEKYRRFGHRKSNELEDILVYLFNTDCTHSDDRFMNIARDVKTLIAGPYMKEFQHFTIDIQYLEEFTDYRVVSKRSLREQYNYYEQLVELWHNNNTTAVN